MHHDLSRTFYKGSLESIYQNDSFLSNKLVYNHFRTMESI